MPLLLLLALLLPLSAGALELRTTDGLALEVDDRGAVTGVRLGAADQPLTGRGGFFLADVARLPCRDEQLVKCPGFEDLADGRPVGWEVGADWSLDTAVHHTGSNSMHVRIPAGRKRNSGALAVQVPVQPNTPYRVAMWLRTAASAPSLYLVQLDGEGKPHADYPQICVSHARTNADWFELSRDLVTAPFCRTLRVYTSLWDQTGEAWVDEVCVTSQADDYVTPQQPVTGTLRPVTDGYEQTSELPDLSLRLRSTCVSRGDHLEVSGELQDTSGQDRALTLSYRLPLEAAGWNWYEDLGGRQRVEPGVTYGAARSFGDRRLLGLYPFAALGKADGALALAVPMDLPRAFRLCYQQGRGLYLNYELALTPETLKFTRRASFRFLLYRTDPAWGFRSAAERYYRLQPQFFTRRLPGQADAGFMTDLSSFEKPERSAPAAAIWAYQQRAALEAYRREQVRLYSYTEFSGWWGWALGLTPEQAQTRPTPEQALERVRKLAGGEKPNDVAQCVLNCAPYDAEGKPLLHDSYEARWGGYNYLCNPDPEISGLGGGEVNRYRLTREREVSQVEPYKLDGLYFDCVFVFCVDNFRREHFRFADNPLVFDHRSKRPVLPLAFSIYECAQALSEEMHAAGRTVMSNYSVTDFSTDLFCIQFIDLIGNEMLWTWTTDAKLGLQRVLAFQKPISMSWQEAKTSWAPERVERELKQAMFYGTFYSLSNLGQEVHDRWVPLTARLATAGWEPVTYARTETPVLVERFGDLAGHDLHFTLRNPTAEARTVALTLEAGVLRLGQAPGVQLWVAKDALTYEPLSATMEKQAWRATVPLPANDTVVVRVGTPADLAADYLAEVPPLLTKAASYRNALQAAKVVVTAPAYETVQAQVAAAVAAGRAGQLSAAQGQCRELAGLLTPPTVEGAVGDQATWAARMARYTDQARARLLAAATR